MAEEKNTTIIIKKKKGGGHGAHGGAWKVAYADFVTAMMAFFMVMWLMGSDEETKEAIANYFNNSQTYLGGEKGGSNPFDDKMPSGAPGGVMEDVITKPSKPLAVHADEQRILSLIAEVFEGSAFHIATLADEVKFSIPSSILFAPGSDELSHDAIGMLQKLGRVFKEYSGVIEIEGHTNKGIDDAVGEKNAWELSFNRAYAIRNYLVEREKVKESKLIPVAKGNMFPVTSNPKELRKNRRVQFILRHNRQKPY